MLVPFNYTKVNGTVFNILWDIKPGMEPKPLRAERYVYETTKEPYLQGGAICTAYFSKEQTLANFGDDSASFVCRNIWKEDEREESPVYIHDCLTRFSFGPLPENLLYLKTELQRELGIELKEHVYPKLNVAAERRFLVQGDNIQMSLSGGAPKALTWADISNVASLRLGRIPDLNCFWGGVLSC